MFRSVGHGGIIGIVLGTAILSLPAGQSSLRAASPIQFNKTVIDTTFRSEGVAIGDVNKDGAADILVGDWWYEAPDWKAHEIREPGDYGDGAAGYSQSFAVWADDVNRDGWVDQIVIGFPGAPCHWYENPKGASGHWTAHEIWHSACNETPLYADLFGTGQRVIVMGWQPKGQEHQGQMAWFTPGKDPTQTWEMHPISAPSTAQREVPGTFKYSHGLGVGDVNGDQRRDVICTGGWWEQPEKLDGSAWKFHPVRLGEDCADMHAYDITGDGRPDVISSSAHRYGIWSHVQRGTTGDAFLTQTLFPKQFSQSHALHCVDLDGDGLKDLVTGKRWWAHGPKGDVAPNDDPVVYWFQASRQSDGTIKFIPHQIDDSSGIGTQFAVDDVNGDGKLDIATSNKRGVFLFVQASEGGEGPASDEQGKFRSLFNGKDLTGWDTWLGRPHPSVKGVDVKKNDKGQYVGSVGLNKDPTQVYTVVMEDGEPAIHISGEIFGAITTQAEFENYHLRLQFKWGEKKWPPRDKAKRDSGLLYHCYGEHGAQGTFWMRSLEEQIQEGDCGDFWSVGGTIVDVTGTRKGGKGPVIYQPGGMKYTVPAKGLGNRIIKSVTNEKPHGQWNTIELFTFGQTAVHVVNGTPNLVLTGTRANIDGELKPLTKGKIQIQSEGAEVFYRRIEVRPITEIPARYLSGE